MSKIEPMGVEEIKAVLGTYFRVPTGSVYRLVLTWIHAEARARTWEHWHDKNPLLEVCDICAWGVDEHIDAVKKEVGWPEGE